MQQFTVPQFIDVEAKIFGPLSIRQFVILLSGGVLTVLYYRLFDFSLFLFSGILTLAASGLFAFAKVRGMELHYFLLCFFQTLIKPMLRVWRRFPEGDYQADLLPAAVTKQLPPRQFSVSHLNKLSLIVDTRGYYSGDDADSNVFRKDKEPEDMLIG